ncbi:hypothetical protein CSQ85_11865 [Bifidobacterium rousetti]|uniref:hypothetical protein n=1 Tax=Bifidobacterium rousetti TaxID=2045439 RepID=UPI00123B45D8|nr:hypothetical protein [Bifidobacterium rousetti]KAA8816115.1 hypothetical protein CSQ85_11865 [Bifidobacterium rousetti]
MMNPVPDPQSTSYPSGGVKSPARDEAEEYAAGVVAMIAREHRLPDIQGIANIVADAYETARTRPVRGRLLERVAQAHYEYVTGNVRQALPFENIDHGTRKEIMEATQALLDQYAHVASTPEP